MTRKVTFAVLFVALLAGACSQAQPNSQAPSVTTSVDPSASVDATATPGSTASARPSLTPSRRPSGPTYPTTARSYGTTLLTAWGAKNTNRVAQLAVSTAILQLRDPESQDKQWAYVSCDASGDTTACLFRNSYGDEITLSLTTAALGQPTAVTEALVDRTSYAGERGAYASDLVQAWQSGNVQRMTRLANSTVANYLKAKTPFENFTATDMVEKVRVEPASAGGGSGAFLLTIDSAKLGSAHAITAVAAA